MQGIIFDLDGTLLESMWVWDNVAERFLISKGITPTADINERAFVMSTTDVANMFIEEFKVRESVKEIKRDIVGIIAKSYMEDVELKPFAREYLEKVSEEGIRLCALTASELVYIVPTLKRLGVYDYFQFVTSCSELGMDKNSYKIFDVVSQRLGVEKNRVTVFEDGYHALENAKIGGYRTVGVYDSASEKYLESVKKHSDRFILSFEELV